MIQTKVLPVILNRRSVRRFDPKPVEREKILTCIEAARLAPSAENVQPWRFLVIDDPEIKSAFGEAAFSGIYRRTRWALKAPVIVVLLAQPDLLANRIGRFIQKIPFYLLDLGISGEHLVLQAQELGLGTCWIGWFDIKKTRQFFKLPKSIKVCQLMALGYPEKAWKAKPHNRKPLDDLVRFNRRD
jgi:nitroreductase